MRIPGLSHSALPTIALAQSPEKEKTKWKRKEKAVEEEEEDKELPEGRICVSEFVREEDIAAMPSLEAPLTRKRRRASDVIEKHVQLPATKPRGKRKDVILPVTNGTGTASSSKAETLKGELKVKGEKERLTNGVNGVHKSEILISIPNEVEKRKKDARNVVEKMKEVEAEAGKESMKEKDKEDREKDLERNIDNVIFGDVTFKAWYPSWYPKEIIGEKALSCTVEGKGPGITVKELYVCRRCFGYSKVLVDWVRHCRCCEREVPGTKVYSHGAEEEEGGWSVWEVDGGVETVSLRSPPFERGTNKCH